MRRRIWWVLLGLGLVLAVAAVVAYVVIGRFVNLGGQLGEGGEARVATPRGFAASIFADGLDGPRFIAFGPDGVLHVADRGSGRILALPDTDGDGVADERRVVARGLEGVHSLTHHDGAWYAGIPSGIVRLDDTDGDGVADQRVAVVDDYPTDGSHSTRTVAFLPDGRMVVSIGSSCNVCREQDPRRAAIVVYDGPDGAGERVLASGLRNAVGLAVHPTTGELWATNNGRDLLGDDLPPETVYRIRDGADYGWPDCINGTMEDPDEGAAGACDGVDRPVVEMQAHSAPLGMTFYTGDAYPAEYRDDLFIALHGSWNRSELTGYKIVRLPFEGDDPADAVEDFATGWLDETTGEVAGRPVGLAVGPDGALYMSDDKAGFIYRINYAGG
ncbi:MAG TPA: PQQ-dependent sugar dehydrogenase [Euzebyales bacterium]|nr:PQQ-dependent sugar dehydrogenase [Euzebyales bacterium]